ncbi:TonB-dependent receptor plug domain-containing protein [Asticcacaulis endophyticus]|uniref:Outer membrane receptor for ferrienterochelin and colicins n=1 Tax=Asticcacaulis endophyticus TaxID=1395890 RepID=A0A918Q3A5_9CAUL|nr:TonB-dependent receptor [Asticcacaulis endophyticus]GGZ32408.1 hypothetical protein GCM10011273_18190 [Asticcacaulis endophyticus]
MSNKWLKRHVSGAAIVFAQNFCRLSALPLLVGLTVAPPISSAQTAQVTFDIPSGPATKSLQTFSEQAGIAVTAPFDVAAKIQTSTLKGNFTPSDALKKLLDGTDLEIANATSKTISLRIKVLKEASTRPEPAVGAATERDPVEVVVTGTRLRNVAPTSPLKQLGRAEIEGSAFSRLGDLLRAQTEVFGGSQNPGVQAGSPRQGQSNITNGSTIDLRGLGSDATLVLLNGKRLPGNAYTQAPDVSAIPLAALSRVEILTDGASAVYGADAVAGVVNFILRKDLDETEVGARLGGATQGGGFEQAYDVTAGKTWTNGFAMVGAQYRTQQPILASDRELTSEVVPVNSLVRKDERTSIFLAGEHSVSDRLTLRGQGLLSRSQSGSLQQTFPDSTLYIDHTESQTAHMALGADMEISGDWRISLDVSHADAADKRGTDSEWGYSVDNWTNRTTSAEVGASGTLLHLPSGPVRMAAGLGYRHDFYRYVGYLEEGAKRDIRFAYAEAVAPLVMPSDRKGLNSLDLSFAVRTESYSDFGNTTNPKFGVRYVPVPRLNLRATWGKSFKTPNFNQTAAAGNVYYYAATSVGSTDTTRAALIEYGGNPDLKPEKATSSTIGVDWATELSGFKVSVTYFHIDYKDRVVVPISVLGAALSDPAYATFVIMNPTAQEQATSMASLTGGGQFYNFSGGSYSVGRTLAILKDRWVNASNQQISGFDVRANQRLTFATGVLDASVSITDMTINQATLPGNPAQTLTGTLFYPPSTRIVSALTWEGPRWRIGSTVNYISDAIDTGVTPNARIASWTTVDLIAGWRLRGDHRTELQLAVTNLFDRDPPIARGAAANYPGLYYDGTTASPVGRFIAVTLRHRF